MSLGGVPERSNGAVLKTVGRASASWVRIPPPPLESSQSRFPSGIARCSTSPRASVIVRIRPPFSVLTGARMAHERPRRRERSDDGGSDPRHLAWEASQAVATRTTRRRRKPLLATASALSGGATPHRSVTRVPDVWGTTRARRGRQPGRLPGPAPSIPCTCRSSPRDRRLGAGARDDLRLPNAGLHRRGAAARRRLRDLREPPGEKAAGSQRHRHPRARAPRRALL